MSVEDKRDQRDPQAVGEFILGRGKTESATYRADNLKSVVIRNYDESPEDFNERVKKMRRYW